MIKNPRFRVVRFIERANDNPETSERYPLCTSAELECGHVLNLGTGTDYRPKRMACYQEHRCICDAFHFDPGEDGTPRCPVHQSALHHTRKAST